MRDTLRFRHSRRFQRSEKQRPCFCGQNLGGRFGYFLFFFCSGEGSGNPWRQEGAGVSFLLRVPGGGGFPTRGGGEGPGGCLRGTLGGGAKYFFSGPKCPPRNAHSSFSPLSSKPAVFGRGQRPVWQKKTVLSSRLIYGCPIISLHWLAFLNAICKCIQYRIYVV